MLSEKRGRPATAISDTKSSMNYRTLIGTLLVLCVSLVAAGQPQSGITGEIVDAEGAAIANARVLVHWDSAGSTVGLSDNVGIQHDVIVTTDSNRRYLAEVPAGFYDVFVSAMAFTPTAAKVRVKKNVLPTTQHSDQIRWSPMNWRIEENRVFLQPAKNHVR
jgi:hypothetical protein